MGNALRYGLMGAVSGGLSAVLALAQEAKTERLRQARMAEEQALRAYDRKLAKEEKLADREYSETRDDKKHERDRKESLSDYDRVRADKATDDAATREQQLKVAGMYAGGRAESAEGIKVVELPDGSHQELLPGETIPEGARVVSIDGRFAPARTRERNPSGASPSKNAPSPDAATAPTGSPASKPPRSGQGAAASPGTFSSPYKGGGAKPAQGRPAAGSSRESPLDAATLPTKPPSGTWVRLPSGAVVQVP